MLTTDECQAVLALARAALQSHLSGDGSLAGWHAVNLVRGGLAEPAGAFVTLHRTGQESVELGRLRACMGVLDARERLADAVVHAAEAAAHDPRFAPLELDELGRLALEVSVLSPRWPVASLAEVEVGRHGVVLRKGGRSAVFLPQVAVEQGWDLETMLGFLALKAGLGRDGWREGTDLEVFTAQVLDEIAAG